MNNRVKSEGDRFSLYFPPSHEHLLNYISNQVDENGKKINRNKFILKLIDEHFQRNQNSTHHSRNNTSDNVSNQDLLSELQQLKEMVQKLKIVDSETIPLNIKDDYDSSSISLTKEELQQLNNPTF